MSETITMTVPQARAVLGNTRGMSGKQVDEAQRVTDKFHASRPRRACVACGCMIWAEHTAGDDAVWACDRCHRGPDLTSEQWFAEQMAEREAADAHLRATEPLEPRAHLREALARLETARKTLSQTEAALPTARSTLAAAQLKHERATSDAEEVDAAAASHLVASFQGARSVGPVPSAMASRTGLAAAVDGLAAARGAKALLDEQLSDQRTAVAMAQSFARKAAITAIAALQLETLLTEAVETRARYVDAIGSLAWLAQHHMIPGDDARARQLVADANTPPSAWPEARTAGTAQMEAALAALLNDPEAPI